MYYLDILMKVLTIVDGDTVVTLPIKSFELTGFDGNGNYLATIVLPVKAYDSTYADSIPEEVKPKEAPVAPVEVAPEAPVAPVAN